MVLQRNMSLSWLGEQAQSQFLDRNLENHEKSQQRDDRDHQEGCCSSSDSRGSGDGGGGGGGSFGSQKSFPSYQKLNSYNSLDLNNYDEKYTIRHQVIVWNVGTPDVKNNRVSLMFRVTLFWNDPLPPKPPSTIEKLPSTLDEALKAAMADSNANANANAYASAYDNTMTLLRKEIAVLAMTATKMILFGLWRDGIKLYGRKQKLKTNVKGTEVEVGEEEEK